MRERLRGLVRRLGAPGSPSPVVVFALVAAAHGLFAAAAGVLHSADTAAYAGAADQLIASGFDYPAVVGQARSTYPSPLYVLFATLVAVLKLVFGAGWDTAVVVINVLAAAGVAAALSVAARRATGSAWGGWGAVLLFLACFDITMWTPYVLSDTTFLFVSFGVFALAADRLLHRERSWAPVFALALAAAFYRPTGVVLLPASAWALYLSRSRPGAGRRAVTAAAAGAVVAGTFVFAWLVPRPELWPVQLLDGARRATARGYAIGEVVSARPETFHAPPDTLLEYVAITADRFLHFFAVAASDFSVAHKLVNAVFYLPAFVLVFVLFAAILAGRDGLSQPQRDVFLAAAAFVLVTAVFHALLQVDFDWRYRYPILPHLALLASGGVAVLLRRRAAVP